MVEESFGEHGRLTEWLGSGLQNRLRRFESATDLNKILPTKWWRIIFLADLNLFRGGIKNNPPGAEGPEDFIEGSPKTGSPKVIRHEFYIFSSGISSRWSGGCEKCFTIYSESVPAVLYNPDVIYGWPSVSIAEFSCLFMHAKVAQL